MEQAFPWAYRPSQEALTELWSEATVAVDASALLNLYQYGGDAREQFLAAMEKLGDRLWFPRRAVEEYLTKRESVIVRQHAEFEPLRQAFGTPLQKVRAYEKDATVDHGRLAADTKRLMEIAKQANDEANKAMGEASRDHVDVTDDPVLGRLKAMATTRLGRGIPDAELEALYQEARTRYEQGVPPGYEDRDKAEPAKFGDFLIWRELLDRAEEVGRPVVFVTDDLKPNWWQWQRGGLVGPRQELVAEMHRVAGVRFHTATSDGFLRYAQQALAIEQDETVIEEVREVSRGGQERASSVPTLRRGVYDSLASRALKNWALNIARDVDIGMGTALQDSIAGTLGAADAATSIRALQNAMAPVDYSQFMGAALGAGMRDVLGSAALDAARGIHGGAPFVELEDEEGEDTSADANGSDDGAEDKGEDGAGEEDARNDEDEAGGQDGDGEERPDKPMNQGSQRNAKGRRSRGT